MMPPGCCPVVRRTPTQPWTIRLISQFLFHSFAAYRFRYNYNAALDKESECGLRNTLAVFFAHFFYCFIGEKVLSALGKGPPALVRDAVFFHYRVSSLLLLEDVCFNLVYRRLYLAEVVQIEKPVGIEV